MRPEPLGVAALLVPWNDPIAIAAKNLAALLVTGNVVVYKPSEKTPLSGELLAETPRGGAPRRHGVLCTATPGGGRSSGAGDVDVVLHTGSVPPPGDRRDVRATLTKAVLGAWRQRRADRPTPASIRAGGPSRRRRALRQRRADLHVGRRIYVHRDVAAPFLRELTHRP